MTVKCVRKYQADDGSLHDTQREALKHNAQYKILGNLRTLLDKAGVPGTAHISLLNDAKLATALRDEMNKVLTFHREFTGKITVNKKTQPPINV